MLRKLLIILVMALLLVVPSASSADDDLLDAFYSWYYQPMKDLISFAHETEVAHEYWRTQKQLHEYDVGVLENRMVFAEAALVSDRIVGVLLSIPLTPDPGNFTKALSVIGVVSNVNGLLDDLGMAEIPEGTEWFYERSSWVAWGALLHDAAGSLSEIKKISQYKNIHVLAQPSLSPVNLTKLLNLQLFAVSVADWALDKTLMSQVRSTYRLDRIKLFLAINEMHMASELEKLYKKAESKTLTSMEATAVMGIEANYYASRADSFAQDIQYWQEELHPTTGTLPFSKKTLMDLIPGYDDSKTEQEMLEYSQRMCKSYKYLHSQALFFIENMCERASQKAEEKATEEQLRKERGLERMAKSLLAYAQAGDAPKVKTLLGEGVDVNATDEDGNTALILVAASRHEEVVEILLSNGADVNARNGAGETALMRANSDAVVRQLLLKGANVGARNKDDKTALYLFVERHGWTLSPEVITTARRMVNAGSDVNELDGQGRTLLFFAAGLNDGWDGRLDLATLLVELGVDVNKSDAWNRTPLMIASGSGESEIVDLLLSEGAHVDAEDGDGRTALMYAAGHNQEWTENTDVIERLIRQGANIEAQDEAGRTSLMYAVMRCNLDDAELLLGKGADPLLTDSDGRTIFELDIQYRANLFVTDYYERDSQKNCQQLADLLTEVKATLAPEEVKGKPIEGEPIVTQHLGTITYQETPKTWTINVPEGSDKVEVAIYGYGKENQQGMYGGWAAYLKVNGKYAWEFTRFDKELGGVIYDHLKGEEVLEVNGKDSYYDVTSMIAPGENTITYYHFSEGPGIGVKVRIHRKV